MALNVWTQPSGYSFGLVQEKVTISLSLPTSNDSGVTYQIISGALPRGLTIQGNSIVGTPFEVSRITDYDFCIRARNSTGQFSDRTYKISVDGADVPVITTPAGTLAIGQYQQFFVLDGTFVDYQIQAFDQDTTAGQALTYFIAADYGILPPGLVLTDSGKITGFIQPSIALRPEDGTGTFDNSYYDAYAYDFAVRPSNGYDSFFYGSVFYDYSIATAQPKKLNRIFEFTVTVTDGDSVIKRTFKIYVVGDDYFRADNTRVLDEGLFTADVTYLRSPIWLTASDLGTYRANNYVTLVLDTYDTENVIYNFEQVNADITTATLRLSEPDNVQFGNKVTIVNPSSTPVYGQYLTFANEIFVSGVDTSKVYQINLVASLGNGRYRLTLTENLTVSIPDGIEFFIGSLSTIPPGLSFDIPTAELYGVVPYQPAITKTYTFTVTAKRLSDNTETVKSARKFTIDIIGEIDSVITWNTNTNLGSVDANYVSTLSVNASSTIPNALILYYLEYFKTVGGSGNGTIATVYFENQSVAPFRVGQFVLVANVIPNGYNGLHQVISTTTDSISFYSTTQGDHTSPGTVNLNSLPPGLSLDLSGEIVGKVNQFGDGTTIGLTRFFDQANPSAPKIFTTFDNGITTIDRVYTFTVEARDQFGLSSTKKEFTVLINTPNQLVYSNLKVRPFLKLTQRSQWQTFINDNDVFTTSNIYRPNDQYFGVQTELSMLVFAGIEQKSAAEYVAAIALNHKRKRFHFGEVKKASAILPGTNTTVYEVVYIEMIDPMEPNGKRLPIQLNNIGLQTRKITVDNSTAIWQGGFPAGFDQFGRPLEGVSQSINLQLNGDKIDKLAVAAPDSQRPDPIITVDSVGYNVSNPNPGTFYPNSISNWRDRISQVGTKERNYLPLWMRSIQPGTRQELGFKLAIPLCYCKVGTADDIILNIKYSGFNFKLLDYTADRYIIDSVEGQTTDKYLVFRNDRITV